MLTYDSITIMCIELGRNNNNNKSCVYIVRNLLQRLGFDDVWLNEGVGNIDLFLHLFKQRVTDIFIQNWNAELTDSSRPRTYVLISGDTQNPSVKIPSP